MEPVCVNIAGKVSGTVDVNSSNKSGGTDIWEGILEF